MQVFTIHKNGSEDHDICEGKDVSDVLTYLQKQDLSDITELKISRTEFYFIRDEDL